MAEYEVYVESDYDDDVEIDLSLLDRQEKARLIKAILENGTYEFKDVNLYFAGDVYVEIDPPYY